MDNPELAELHAFSVEFCNSCSMGIRFVNLPVFQQLLIELMNQQEWALKIDVRVMSVQVLRPADHQVAGHRFDGSARYPTQTRLHE